MKLAKLTDEERVNISKKYYIGGFFLLPWLWIINTFWFFPFAVKSGADPKLRKMVVYSAIGSIIWVIIIAVWVSQYQQNRVAWGETGDKLTANYPKGRE
eukprot:m.59242 g.59242  ORF g.59242 m.59242 type:complete len:99 (+) comp15676_c0_seq1:128-424(+)